jgi:glycerol-3-phosphate dehydrogenase
VDRRNVFLLPWLGVTFVGTTDLDHDAPADTLPVISDAERSYLLEAVNAMFPEANITEADVISTWSGVRPVVSSGAKDPSKESRDMFIDLDRGLLTVTGGKLTTFRNEAIHALAKLDGIFPTLKGLRPRPFANPAMKRNTELSRYLSAAYGADAAGLESRLEQEPSLFFAGTQILKEAARYALEREWVVHLDDLMIRRLRLGILLPEGGKAVLGEIRTMCLKAGWSEDYYAQEEQRYKDLIAKRYS